jgi:hypothetical protein
MLEPRYTILVKKNRSQIKSTQELIQLFGSLPATMLLRFKEGVKRVAAAIYILHSSDNFEFQKK